MIHCLACFLNRRIVLFEYNSYILQSDVRFERIIATQFHTSSSSFYCRISEAAEKTLSIRRFDAKVWIAETSMCLVQKLLIINLPSIFSVPVVL